MIKHDHIAETGYKIFAVGPQDAPRTLVHGRPLSKVGPRTRIVPRDSWIESETGKPPFHLFSTLEAAELYLPRFRVRASELVICPVRYHTSERKPRSNYLLARWMRLSSEDWRQYALADRVPV